MFWTERRPPRRRDVSELITTPASVCTQEASKAEQPLGSVVLDQGKCWSHLDGDKRAASSRLCDRTRFGVSLGCTPSSPRNPHMKQWRTSEHQYHQYGTTAGGSTRKPTLHHLNGGQWSNASFQERLKSHLKKLTLTIKRRKLRSQILSTLKDFKGSVNKTRV